MKPSIDPAVLTAYFAVISDSEWLDLLESIELLEQKALTQPPSSIPQFSRLTYSKQLRDYLIQHLN